LNCGSAVIVVIGFFGILLPPLEITQGRFQESDRIFEPPEAPVAVVAKETPNDACAVVVVDGESTHPATTTPVTFRHPADGTPAILPVKKALVPLGGKTASASLVLLLSRYQALAAEVLPLNEGRKLFADLLLPATLAHRSALSDTPMSDPVKPFPGQVRSHRAERHTSPSGNLTDR
jgi:hypothetical protein